MSRWLFFPTQSTGPLQVMTWVMTSSSTATVSYTGLEIIQNGGGGLSWASQNPRFWVGPGGHSGHTGWTGSRFDTSTNCRLSWHYYAVSVSIDGGSSVSLNSTSTGGSGNCAEVAGSVYGCCQTNYINCKSIGTNMASGQTLVFTVTAVS